MNLNPKSKKTRISFYLAPETIAALERLADEEGRSQRQTNRLVVLLGLREVSRRGFITFAESPDLGTTSAAGASQLIRFPSPHAQADTDRS